MKLKIKAFALASGAASAIIYVIGCIIFAIAPGFTLKIFSYIGHADFSIFTKVFNFGNFILGLIILFVVSYLSGALFAWFYNKFLKEA